MLIWILLIALIGSCFAIPISHLAGRWAGWVLSLLPAGLFATLIAAAPVMERGWVLGDGMNWAPRLGIYLTFRLDGFSFLMSLLITGIGTLVVIYSGAYFNDKSVAERGRFLTLILLFMTAMLGAVLADNMIVMLVFWEATSILSFLLIGFDGKSIRARRSALMSLYVTAAGGLALLAAILLIGQELGTYSLGEIKERIDELAVSPMVVPILAGIMIAAFTKSAQFPFHFWLPNAMQAPTPASAYLHSATMVKLGIYLLSRFEPLIAAVPGGRQTLIAVGAISMLVAALQALRAENFKTALAYSTIASLGILVTLIGLTGPASSVAMVGFLFAHALYKAALFFCAGSVLHATGLSTLRSMGGLARYLPVTALATVLASLSMAGLPPFFGFISKEFLFQAQLESTPELLPMAIIVLVNAVMVGVAAVITLRPFFLGHDKVRELRHGESFGIVFAPLVLALAGLFLSLDPEWVTANVLRPAAIEVYGQVVAVDVSLWHGLTPMLLLSFVVVSIGALIAFNWKRIHLRLQKSLLFDRHGIEGRYEAMILLVFRGARRLTRTIQHGDMRRHLWMIIASALILLPTLWICAGVPLRIPDALPIQWGPGLTAIIGTIGALAATRTRSLISTMIAVGLAGFAVAINFMLGGAPDLALTQFTVEALIVVLLTALLLAIPLGTTPTRSGRERRADFFLAGVGAIVMFIALLDMAAGSNDGALSRFFAEQSYVAANGRNVVNVLLVDFRAFDTLGETVVIAMSAIIAWSLLGPRMFENTGGAQNRVAPFILRKTAGLFFWLLLALSVWMLLRGHNEPGGGFIGGLIAALAFAMIALSHGIDRARLALHFHPVAVIGCGLGIALLSGVPGMIEGGAYLVQPWYETRLFAVDVKLSTTMAFDLGVYIVVLGSVLSFLFGLQRETEL